MLKKIKKIIIIFSLLIAGFAAVNFVLAADPDTLLFGGLQNETGNAIGLPGGQDPRVMAANIIRVALGFLGLVAVGIVIYAGWLWMTAAGDAQKIDKAKKVLLGALIGLLLIVASFGIVTFILGKILEAVNVGPIVPPTCGNPPTCDAGETCSNCPSDCGICPPLPGATFKVNNFSPTSPPNTIRNPEVRGFFSLNVILLSATPNNFKFYVVGGSANGAACTSHNQCLSDFCDSATGQCQGDYVDATINVSGIKISLKRKFDPQIACPVPNNTIACLSANTNFEIQAVDGATGLKGSGSGNIQLSCGGFNPLCTANFTTGTLVDVSPPTISINTAQFCAGVMNTINANTTDDAGIAYVDFFENGTPPLALGTDFPFSPPPLLFNASINWDTTGPTYSAGGAYEIEATVYDVDSNNATDKKSFTLRPDHCCNGIQDGDETGFNCGGSCAACSGAACAIDKVGAPSTSCSDDLCASGFCTPSGSTQALCTAAGYASSVSSCCLCQDSPIIDWVTPMGGFCKVNINTPCQNDVDCGGGDTCDTLTPNGADGNLVTIGGRFFGTFGLGSKVEFSEDNGANWKTALLASTKNNNCDNSWQDTQIIVVVPEPPNNLSSGLGKIIKVTADNGFFDITNDSRGESFDFVINTISRPGLCELNPANGKMDEPITYEGIRLTGVEARFGNMTSFVKALNSNFVANTSGTAEVPNIATGKTTTYVINANINSNFLNFTKNAEAPLGPKITSFEPVQGPPGQYVTIYGSGFGATKGTSKVKFKVGATETEADYSFPAVCANSVWSDNQVIVKVPAGLPDNNYIISMEIGAWVIDTSALATPTFQADNTLPLAPSLCKLEPVMGPNNSAISLYGEYFGAQATGLVRFHLNHDQTAISFWGSSGGADKIETTVHNDAVTGPVRVVQGANVGNGLNFTVGNCTKDADCGGTTCCPAGSFKANMCAVDAVAQGGNGDGSITPDDCYVKIGSSVYEWDFSTGAGLPVSTCAGYTLNQCALANFCPNSPGQCSPYAGGVITQLGDCGDAACNGVGACTAVCTYNSSLNKCVDPTQPCDLNGTALDIFGKDITKYCALYNGNKVWHINTPASCPATWTRIPGNKCVDSTTADTCELCSGGFKCADIGGAGQCVVDQNICPSGSTCNLVNEKCEKTDKAKCECCCEIGEDARDCCAPLKCEGTCGSGAGYGMCSGCKIDSDGDGSISAAEQTLSDAACNCAGTTGKYCDTTVSNGVCKDAAPTGSSCYNPATNVGNCDNTMPNCSVQDYCDPNSCKCEPIVVGTLCDEVAPYPVCDINIDICDQAQPGVLFCDPTHPIQPCTCQLVGAIIGSSCDAPAYPQCAPANFCIQGLQCLTETPSTDCGNCCCDMTNDQCNLINSVLTCRYDTGSGGTCDDTQQGVAPDFGLCCGCSTDAQCGTLISTGCGFDTCCRSRPTVDNVSPLNGEDDVCRNVLITATFDQTMDISSFSGNVIVVGDYETGLCPAGTEYILASGQKEKGFFARLFQKIALPFRRLLKPLFPGAEALTNNFCAIAGAVSGVHNTDSTTTLTFSPSSLLDANRKYYVIIKGDSDLTDAKKEGVKSYYDVTMADSWMDLDNDGTLEITDLTNNEDRTLNGVKFYGYVWSFTTRDDSQNNGICKIARVEVSPNSYLFKTTADDINEDDSSAAAVSFDTKKDSDKVFVAKAVSSAGQELASVAGVYEWSWSWNSSNNTVVDDDTKNPFSPVDGKQLFEAQPGVTDGFSELEAEATVSGSAALPGESYAGKANVWVFVCENPWPPVDLVTGLWSPWQENSANCTIPLSSCPNTNYELYYCRDTAGAGTADDLPAIVSGNTIIRGSSTVENLLKEFYFFREAAPDVSGGVNLTLTDQTTTPDGIVLASWDAVVGASGYKVYYGITSGSYSDYATTNAISLLINNLTVGKTYYFTVTAYDSATGAESGYSTEVSIMPEDKTSPLTPTGLKETDFACEGKAFLSWNPNSDDTKGYKVYYGASAGIYGGVKDVKSATEVTLTGLTNDTTYYFAVTAYDNYNNESGYSNELSAVAMPDCDILISWWKFDEGSGTTALDSAGSNDGTINGATWDNGGITGTALSFNGVNDYVDLGNDSSLNLGNSDFSIEAWVKPVYQDYNFILTKTSGSGQINNPGDFRIEHGNLAFVQADSLGAVVISSTKPVPNNIFSHIVITKSGSQINFYINSENAGSGTMTITPSSNTKPVLIGTRDDKLEYFKGIIDEVRIYNQALTVMQIQQSYNSYSQSLIQQSLVSHWLFESVAGGITPDIVGGNDGTLNGGVTQVSNGKVGGALDFDGTNGEVNAGNSNDFRFTNEDFTMAAWIKPNSPADYMGIAGATENNNDHYYWFGIEPYAGGLLYVELQGSVSAWAGTSNAQIDISGSKWTHVVVTKQQNVVEIYIDGVKDKTISNAPTDLVPSNNYEFRIGSRGALNYQVFDGQIDEVRIYNRALSAPEVDLFFKSYP